MLRTVHEHVIMQLKKLLPLALLMAVRGCSATAPTSDYLQKRNGSLSLHVVAHEDHTGIAIRKADIGAGAWPESRDFPRAEFLEVGWGARDYYMGYDRGFWGTLKAALGQTQSVLHVAGFAGRPADYFRGAEVIELPIAPEELARVVRSIHDTYDRAGGAVAASLGPGLYGDSRFYPSWEHFSLLNTCNVWTARALRSGGLPIRDAITREGVMSQVRELAQRPAPRDAARMTW
jgi:uncharacterized protein (TIGR02117 family)